MCFSHYWNHIALSALVQGGWLCPKSLFLRKVSGAKPLGQPVGQMDSDYRNLSRRSLQKLQSCQESSVHLSRVLSQLPFCRCLPFSCWDLLHPSCSVSLLCRQTSCSRCSPLWCGWELTSLLKSSFLCVKFDDLITLLRYERGHLFGGFFCDIFDGRNVKLQNIFGYFEFWDLLIGISMANFTQLVWNLYVCMF